MPMLDLLEINLLALTTPTTNFYDWGFVGGSAIIVLLAALGVAVFRRRQHSALLVFPAIAGITMLLSIGLVF